MQPSRSSKPRRGLIARSLLLFSMLGVVGCNTIPRPQTPFVPQSLREPCRRPDPTSVATVGALAAFSVRQDEALSVCDSTRLTLLQIIDGTQPKPKRKLWPF